MKSRRVENGWDALQSAVDEYDRDEKIHGILLLATPGEQTTPETVDPILTEVSTPIFGGVYPKLLHEGDVIEDGAIVAGIEADVEINTISNISDPQTDFKANLPERHSSDDELTAIVLADAYAERVSELINDIFHVCGDDISYIGGGTGSLDMEQQPTIFSNEGLLEDAAIYAEIKGRSSIGVKHGWERIKGPIRVTGAEGQKVETLGGDPAFDVYRDIIKEDSGKEITADNFFEIAKHYPLGIDRIGGEVIVRDPFEANEDGSLTCFGDIGEDEFIYVLKGDKDNLIEAAREAYEEATADGDGADIVTFDCISRVLYLEDQFEEELDAIGGENEPQIGALTIGEITNGSKGHLVLYNKTAVTTAINWI